MTQGTGARDRRPGGRLVDSAIRLTRPVARARHQALPAPRWARRGAKVALAAGAPGDSRLTGLEIQRTLRTDSETLVAFAGRPGEHHTVVVKVARTPFAGEGLRHEHGTLRTLHDTPRLAAVAVLVPEPIALGEVEGVPYAIESFRAGRPAPRRLDSAAGPADALVERVVEAVGKLHRETAATRRVDAARLEQLVDAPLETAARLHPLARRTIAPAASIERVRLELRAELDGCELCVASVHGDYWAANVLLAPAADEVTGVIDWTFAASEGYPVFDLLDLLVSVEGARRRCELGEVLSEMVGRRTWPGVTEHARRALADLPGEPIAPRTAALLYWVRLLDRGLRRVPSWSRHPVWIRGNVGSVLAEVGR